MGNEILRRHRKTNFRTLASYTSITWRMSSPWRSWFVLWRGLMQNKILNNLFETTCSLLLWVLFTDPYHIWSLIYRETELLSLCLQMPRHRTVLGHQKLKCYLLSWTAIVFILFANKRCSKIFRISQDMNFVQMNVTLGHVWEIHFFRGIIFPNTIWFKSPGKRANSLLPGSSNVIRVLPKTMICRVLINFPMDEIVAFHDDVIKWKQFPRYWPFAWGIHRSQVNSPRNYQWRGALMFSLICAWRNAWINNREAGDLRRHRAHYDVIVMFADDIFVCIFVKENFRIWLNFTEVCFYGPNWQ